MITRILDHAALAVARLLLQYRGKIRLAATASALGEQVQSLEDALQQVLENRVLDTATGEQLDVLGILVGQARAGVTDDEEYRAYITARIAANRSGGTLPEILDTLNGLAVARLPGAEVVLVEQFPAGFVIRIGGVISTEADVDFLLTFLRPMKPAGVRALIEWYPAATADLFTWDGDADQAWDQGKWANAKAA